MGARLLQKEQQRYFFQEMARHRAAHEEDRLARGVAGGSPSKKKQERLEVAESVEVLRRKYLRVEEQSKRLADRVSELQSQLAARDEKLRLHALAANSQQSDAYIGRGGAAGHWSLANGEGALVDKLRELEETIAEERAVAVSNSRVKEELFVVYERLSSIASSPMLALQGGEDANRAMIVQENKALNSEILCLRKDRDRL